MRIAVGGHSRGAGKTAVICGIVSALKDARWTCVKVTPHGHAAGGLVEETDAAGARDTSRYLAAGARRAYLLGAKDVEAAAAGLRAALAAAPNAIVESARMAEVVEPDLRIAVVNAGGSWKAGAEEFIERADAVAVVAGEYRARVGQRVFRVGPPEYKSEELIEVIKRQLVSP